MEARNRIGIAVVVPSDRALKRLKNTECGYKADGTDSLESISGLLKSLKIPS
jgi:hypothetical protein